MTRRPLKTAPKCKKRHEYNFKILTYISYILVCLIESSMKKRFNFANGMDTSTHPTTVITAFFQFDKSKHSSSEYKSWINNFLPHVATPMVVFTDKESSAFIKNVRNGHPIFLLVYDTVWDMPSPISSRKHRYQNDQYELDPEKTIHSADLYATWNSKAWMVSYTTELNPFNSTYFYWVDIGAFRSQGMRRARWPDFNLVDEMFKHGTVNRLHVFVTQNLLFDEDDDRLAYTDLSKIDLIVGGFFGGTRQAVSWWSNMFYETHDAMMDKGYFVGKDQTIMNYILLRHKSKFFVSYLQTYRGMIGIKDCDNAWFYFINWYSAEMERTPCCPVLPLYKLEDLFHNVNSSKLIT